MKFVAVFFAVMNGQIAIVEDMDGPTEFVQARACIGHVVKVQPTLQRMIRDFLPGQGDLIVHGFCRSIGIMKPER